MSSPSDRPCHISVQHTTYLAYRLAQARSAQYPHWYSYTHHTVSQNISRKWHDMNVRLIRDGVSCHIQILNYNIYSQQSNMLKLGLSTLQSFLSAIHFFAQYYELLSNFPTILCILFKKSHDERIQRLTQA